MGEEQAVQAFIERWEASGAAERANGQIFLSELCALLDVPPPEPATPAPVTAEELARTFTRARTTRIADLPETLAALGQARRMDDGRYTTG